jgi:large subunit ribosomal protein L13
MARGDDIEQRWFEVDAAGKAPGRLAASIARILQGKHKPTFTPHVDTGDFVVVINAKEMAFTGKKMQNKLYKRYSGHPGGLKLTPAEEMMKKKPGEVLQLAVKRMLPKTKLGRKMLGKLKVYPGAEHPHKAQKPKPLTL